MPEERRLTITSSPHLAPDDVSRHTFASVRRGFDPAEVRDYLESIATGLRAQAEREQELLAALAEAEERAANPVIDDSMLTNAVGKETARVLQSAHDASGEMVANAEAEAARLLAEARVESERLLAEATELNDQAQTRADALLAERTAEAEAATASLRERTEQ
ncbi:MAG TPA: DivIVA domain-containing protein, partial [Acidimicrobiales bacterium]